MAVMLILTQCNADSETGQPTQEIDPNDILCTEVFMTVPIKLVFPDGQPVLLDSSKVFWISQNRYLEQNSVSWNEARLWGIYAIVDDRMQKELENRQEMMHFTGYLNSEIICERDVLVGADKCHVIYLGAESLTLIIQKNPDDEQKNQDEGEYRNIEGKYSGIFTVQYSNFSASGKTSLELKDGKFICIGSSNRIPAGGSGNYSVNNNKIIFEDRNFWTANFDWNLILNEEYEYTFDVKRLKFSAYKNDVGYYEYDLEKEEVSN